MCRSRIRSAFCAVNSDPARAGELLPAGPENCCTQVPTRPAAQIPSYSRPYEILIFLYFQQIANDPASPSYDSSQPVGMAVFAKKCPSSQCSAELQQVGTAEPNAAIEAELSLGAIKKVNANPARGKQ